MHILWLSHFDHGHQTYNKSSKKTKNRLIHNNSFNKSSKTYNVSQTLQTHSAPYI